MRSPGQKDAVSRTARYMALFRALETARGREGLFADPFAVRFLPPWLRAVVLCAHAPPLGARLQRSIERFIDARWPGTWSSAVARTRWIDDRAADAVASGAVQVVLLGAGFDCRAQRLAAFARLPVYEVDRAALLRDKRRRLGPEARGTALDVPVDFLRDDVAAELEAAGLRAGERTLFVWEGVTNYLDARAVASVLDLVARLGGAGSQVLFTYVHADVLDRRFPAAGLDALFARLDALGERWTFGFRPEELPGYLEEHDLRLLADVGAADYRAAVMGERARGLVGYEFYRVAAAEVVAPGGARAEDH